VGLKPQIDQLTCINHVSEALNMGLATSDTDMTINWKNFVEVTYAKPSH
jgi:hypothetical protein